MQDIIDLTLEETKTTVKMTFARDKDERSLITGEVKVKHCPYNAFHKNGKSGSRFISKRGRAFIEDVESELKYWKRKRQGEGLPYKLKGKPVKLKLICSLNTKSKDIDKLPLAFIDVIKNKLISDDSCIYKISTTKRIVNDSVPETIWFQIQELSEYYYSLCNPRVYDYFKKEDKEKEDYVPSEEDEGSEECLDDLLDI